MDNLEGQDCRADDEIDEEERRDTLLQEAEAAPYFAAGAAAYREWLRETGEPLLPVPDSDDE